MNTAPLGGAGVPYQDEERARPTKINILFVIIQMQMGGAERLVLNLISRLDRDIFSPSVAWLSEGPPLKEFIDLNVPLYCVPKRKRLDFDAMRQLAKKIKDNNIEIVNAHHFMPFIYSFYGCKIANRAKLLYTEHSEWDIVTIPWVWKRIGAFLLSWSDGGIGISSAVSRKLRTVFKLPIACTFTVQNGIDIHGCNEGQIRARLRKEWKIREDEKVIGIVANFRKVKNHIFLLKAFSELAKEFQDVRLLVVGKGFAGDAENSESSIVEFVQANTLSEKVMLLGQRSDVPNLLHAMDIFCLTSLREGLPMGLIEAMAAGLPLIGTDVEGIRDVIVPYRTGLLVKSGDVEGLKNALALLLLNEGMRWNMGQEGKRLAAREYSLDRTVAEYEEICFLARNRAVLFRQNS